jgi:hypothetical protein
MVVDAGSTSKLAKKRILLPSTIELRMEDFNPVEAMQNAGKLSQINAVPKQNIAEAHRPRYPLSAYFASCLGRVHG